jgi:hypothetical protein
VIKIRKKVVIPMLTLVTLLTLGVIASNVVSADEAGHATPLVERIAEKFNLNESDVQAVFDAVHDERFEAMKQAREERLNQAVADNVITEEQKQAILNKQTEMQQERTQDREEMKAFWDSLGVDPAKLGKYEMMGHHIGPRGNNTNS